MELKGLPRRNKKEEGISIGELLMLSHGLYGADVGVFLSYAHDDLSNPLAVTHVKVGGVIQFQSGKQTELPDDDYQKWQIGLVARVSDQYRSKYNNIKRGKKKR